MKRKSHSRGIWAPMLAVAVALCALAAWSVWNDFQRHREQASAQLRALAELRGTQVENWLVRHVAQGSFVANSTTFGMLYTRWQGGADAASAEGLRQRAWRWRASSDADTALIVDEQGALLASEHDNPGPAAPALRAALEQAWTHRQPAHTGLYRQEGQALPLRLDIAIPLLHGAAATRGALVMRLDPERWLFPLLTRWPVPSASGESGLWRRVGDQLQMQNQPRRLAGGALRFEQALATSQLPVARLLRGEATAGETFFAIDYKGVPVLASVHPVPGTDWFLTSKITAPRAGSAHAAARAGARLRARPAPGSARAACRTIRTARG